MPSTGHRYHTSINDYHYDRIVIDFPCNDPNCTNELRPHNWVYAEPRPNPVTVIDATRAYDNIRDTPYGHESIIERAMEQPDPRLPARISLHPS